MLRHSIIKKVTYVFIVFCSVLMCINNCFCANSEEHVKRVISLVYDDSFSMKQNGQDYYYANYTLQNIVAMMNDTDEVNVVYLSNENKNNMKNMANIVSRKNYITELKNYSQYSTNTNFDAVRTAVDYLRDKKSLYGNDNSYKYYLVVLTDGIFENAPSNLSKYLSDLRSEFVGGYFKGVFVGIGENINSNFVNSVLNNKDYYYVESKGHKDIIKAVFEAHDIIYNRETLSEDSLMLSDDRQALSFNADKNINRIIVLEQNQYAKVLDISSKGMHMDNITDFRCEKPIEPYLGSVITHTNSSNGALPKGLVRIDFDGPISRSYDNTRVLVEYTDAEAKDSPIEELKKKDTDDIEDDTIGGDEGKGGNDIDDEKELTKSKDKEDVKDTKDPIYPVILHHSRFCICPILRILFLIFLICLAKALRDRKKYVDIDDENNAYIDYYDKRIKLFSGLMLLVIVLFILCHIFWCKLSLWDCLINCWGFLSGCGCRNIVPFIGKGSSTVVSPSEPISRSFTNPSPTPILSSTSTPSPIKKPNPVVPFTDIREWLVFLGPFLIFAILLGYLFKKRLDTKNHGFEIKVGKQNPMEIHAMKVNGISKFIPYVSESGKAFDLQVKASGKKDSVIIPQSFLSPDMKVAGESIDTSRDLKLFEDLELTRMVDGEKVTYIYKNYPDKGINL